MDDCISGEDCQYFLIRIGRVFDNSDGDFIDHIIPELNLAVIKIPKSEIIVIHGPSVKFQIENEAWTIPVEDIVKQINSNINSNILAGLYRSTFEKNDSGLVIHDALNVNCDNYFESKDQELVRQYKNSIFGIGSITEDLSIELNTINGEVIYNGIKYNNISDLYGNFDEDDCWVVGLTL